MRHESILRTCAATLVAVSSLATQAAAQKPLPPTFPTSWNIGYGFGGVLNSSTSVNSTAPGSFYQGGFGNFASPYASLFANVNFLKLGQSSAPFGSWVVSLGPMINVSGGSLTFSGRAGGVPLQTSGHLTEVDYLAVLKLTTPLNPEYDLSLFGTAGFAKLWPSGTPTGIGGPAIIGSDTAFAAGFGFEISRPWIGLRFAYQHTEPTKFETTLAGEHFAFRGKDQFTLGLNFVCCSAPGFVAPPPAGVPEVQIITPEPPPPPKSYCGPDVTSNVLDVLRNIYLRFNTRNLVTKQRACASLVDPRKGAEAWDIVELFLPYWINDITDSCQQPRPQCAHTVEFLGTCQYAERLNYIQWGMMKALCDDAGRMTSMRVAGEAERATYNLVQYGLTPLNDSQNILKDQNNMADVGEEYKRMLDENVRHPNTLSMRTKILAAGGGASQCPLLCPLTAAQQTQLKSKKFRYNWSGLPH
jgi:hypothetical protein